MPRKLFYAVQLWTELRVFEVAALEWRDIDLTEDCSCITLRAKATKVKRADELPLHRDLVGLLRTLRGSPTKPGDHLFATRPTLKPLKGDLERADVQHTKNDRGEALDRHTLRTTFCTWLAQAGVASERVEALARHAPTGTTARRSVKRGIRDLWKDINRLPDIPTGVSDAGRAKATGTENQPSRPVARAPGFRRPRSPLATGQWLTH